MVRYQVANGNAAARLATRDKHFILFDSPADKGAEFKAAFPDIGWAASIDGHPTLPFSIGARLILQVGAEVHNRDVPQFGEFPTAHVLDRIWKAVIPAFKMEADNPFSEVVRVAASLPNKNPFIFISGDWEEVGGDLGEWEGLNRWVEAITRGDCFASSPAGESDPPAGLAAAELLYHLGPYMLEDQRNKEGCHFLLMSQLLGKSFQSDSDDSLCDGAQLATEVAEGIADSVWPDIFMHITEGPETGPDARAGARIMEFRNRIGYFNARSAADASTTKFITKVLPIAVRRRNTLPCLSVIFRGVASGTTTAEGIVRLATALQLASPRRIDVHSLYEIEKLLTPIFGIISASSIADAEPLSRLSAVLDKVDSTHLGRQLGSSTSITNSSVDGDKTTASGKLLLAQLTRPDAIAFLARLAEYRAAPDFDPVTYLEMAHMGRWTAELRQAKLVEATAIKDATAKRNALAALAKDDKQAPVPALMQLAWGHIKALEGYPELQDVYDLGQSHMPDVLARVVARAFSADNKSIPLALRFARATACYGQLKGKAWETELDLVNDADACMLSYIEGGQGTEIVRTPFHLIYSDITRVLRIKRIGANLFAFFGVMDEATNSWRQLVASCEHAFMSIPASDSVKRLRLGRAMQRFISRALGDLGKRIDLVRYTAKHDVVGPRELLPTGKGGARDEFAEAVMRIADDQKRKRSEVSDDTANLTPVCLPSEAGGCTLLGLLPADVQAAKKQAGAPKGVTLAGAVIDTPSTGSGNVEWVTLSLAHTSFTIAKPMFFKVRVNAAAAQRWLHEAGVKKPCLAYLFGAASTCAKQYQSCGQKDNAEHTTAATGPHQVVDGWKAKAPSFVHPQDKAKFLASA